MAEIAALAVFWLSTGLMVHTYLLYPLSLKLLPRRYKPPQGDNLYQPTVAVLIPAHNEAKVIAEKLRNTLSLSYPPDKLEVLVGSDGSTDGTDRIVTEIADSRVRLIRLEGRNGKYRVLNSLVSETQADILLLTDANVTISGDFERFIRHLADESVAAVGAANEFMYSGTGIDVGTGERMYHAYMTSVKQLESEIGGFSGLEGAAYAIRRSCWEPLPLVPMNDDIVSCYPALVNGKRIVFETGLIAAEVCSNTVGSEFRHRVRMGTLNWGTLTCCPVFLSLTRPIVAYTFFSSKVIQWIFPVLMIAAFAANAVLARASEFFSALFAAQVFIYALSALGGLIALIGFRIPILYQLFSFVAIMAAFLIGGLRYLGGAGSAVWDRSAR